MLRQLRLQRTRNSCRLRKTVLYLLPHILELRFLLTSQSQAHLSLQVLTNMRCYRHWEPAWWKPSYFLLSGLPREEKENDSNLRTGLRMKAKYPEEIVTREEKL